MTPRVRRKYRRASCVVRRGGVLPRPPVNRFVAEKHLSNTEKKKGREQFPPLMRLYYACWVLHFNPVPLKAGDQPLPGMGIAVVGDLS